MPRAVQQVELLPRLEEILGQILEEEPLDKGSSEIQKDFEKQECEPFDTKINYIKKYELFK
jgi:hypothetical protein